MARSLSDARALVVCRTRGAASVCESASRLDASRAQTPVVAGMGQGSAMTLRLGLEVLGRALCARWRLAANCAAARGRRAGWARRGCGRHAKVVRGGRQRRGVHIGAIRSAGSLSGVEPGGAGLAQPRSHGGRIVARHAVLGCGPGDGPRVVADSCGR